MTDWVKFYQHECLDEDELEDFKERAAIMQFDGGLAPEHAALAALKRIKEKRRND